MIINLKAGEQQRIAINGRYLRIIEASSELKIIAEYIDGSTESNSMWRGMGWEHNRDFVAVSIESEWNQAIEISYTSGRIDDSRMSGVIDVRQKPLGGIQSTKLTINTVEEIISQANGSRYALRIKNTGATNVYIGTQDVIVDGYPLSPGEFIEIKAASAAEVYAYSDAENGQVVVLEEFIEGQYLSVPIEPLQTNTGAFIFSEGGDYISLGN